MRNPMNRHSEHGSGLKVTPSIGHDLTSTPNTPVEVMCRELVQSYSSDKWETGQEDAFMICDLGDVYRQYLRWKKNLPRVKPYYAIKANTDPMVATLLATLGVGFDCASRYEMEYILGFDVDPDQIIYANPSKQVSHIQYAAQQKVSKMTFDNAGELYKIKAFYPDANLVLRILPDEPAPFGSMGEKFGASMTTIPNLLRIAKELELNIIGVSFHVGVRSMSMSSCIKAIQRARIVFDQAQAIGFNFTLLDIGGGFTGANDLNNNETFEEIASVLRSALNENFSSDIDIISEPGCYFVDAAFTLFTQVIGRRVVEDSKNEPSYMYYLNDGVFGSFRSKVVGVKDPKPLILRNGTKYLYGQDLEHPLTECSLWGPTCAYDDYIEKSIRLPLLYEGDWLYWRNMGAYASSVACEFNGFKLTKTLYTNTFTLHPFTIYN